MIPICYGIIFKQLLIIRCRHSCTNQSRKVGKMKAPWLADAIKKSMYRRDYVEKKAIKTNLSAYHNAYKCLRNEINKRLSTQSVIIT